MNYQELSDKEFISCFKQRAKAVNSEILWMKKEILSLKCKLSSDENLIAVCNGVYHFHRNLIVSLRIVGSLLFIMVSLEVLQ